MRRSALIGLATCLMLCVYATAWCITRINGNQLLEGTGESGFNSQAQRGSVDNRPRLIFSVGQGVMASGTLPDSATGTAMFIGFGLGYDIAHYIVCPVGLTGDLNDNGIISAPDLIMLVQFIYNNGNTPLPCAAIGDVNCTGNVTSSDAMILVNYLFKSGPPPCNVCALIPDSWPCQ